MKNFIPKKTENLVFGCAGIRIFAAACIGHVSSHGLLRRRLRLLQICGAGFAKNQVFIFLGYVFSLLPLFLFAHETPSHVTMGLGAFDVTKDPQPMTQAEYRWDVHFHHIRPLLSGFLTTKGSFYLCAGASVDFFFSEHFVLSPSFAPGFYVKGHGKDLGFPLNFRSAIDVAYDIGNWGRLGVQFQHISNAHMGRKNPGANSLIVYYALPVASIVPTMKR